MAMNTPIRAANFADAALSFVRTVAAVAPWVLYSESFWSALTASWFSLAMSGLRSFARAPATLPAFTWATTSS
ncbi:hypothetical protein AOPFMNJM_4121 [Methylobacterium jeotgali]|uniref:Uncharacterized protein n=1 Tax=Methylobacterium jeotgali TaxID=381630 RepID=A0ABQ4SZY1_9HYPH|nr:hypothetical protein AOPFMNJM_4121 [Methylobacterium jeotgali]